MFLRLSTHLHELTSQRSCVVHEKEGVWCSVGARWSERPTWDPTDGARVGGRRCRSVAASAESPKHIDRGIGAAALIWPLLSGAKHGINLDLSGSIRKGAKRAISEPQNKGHICLEAWACWQICYVLWTQLATR